MKLFGISKWILILLFSILVSLYAFYQYGRSIWFPVYINMIGKRSISDVSKIYSASVEPKLMAMFKQTNLNYPPQKIAFYAIKQEKILELWATNNGTWEKIKNYPILKSSGHLGPKLVEGDMQVPEGVYRLAGLNPNSAYHLSMKINYPNDFDLEHARNEGRDNPGSNIFIHGKAVSIGCLAIGDEAIEELFLLTYRVGWEDVEVVIAPTDLRKEAPQIPLNSPSWTADLYQQIILAGKKFR